MKVLIITNTPSPYRIPLFNALHHELSARNIELVVVFLAAAYARRKWKVDERQFKFRSRYLNDAHLSAGEYFFTGAFSLPGVLIQEDPDLVITAGFSTATLWTLLYARAFAKPFFIWSGETLAEAALRNRFALLRSTMRRWMARYAAGFIVYGSEAAHYVESLDRCPADIFIAINTVDTTFMKDSTAKCRPEREAWLRENKLPTKNILFVGYLERRKGVHLLLEAVHRLQLTNPELAFATHLVGSGSEEEHLRSLVLERGMTNVCFWGYKQKEELPPFFAMADALVFCSTSELYGLVPIEGMAAGLPVIGSPLAGCAKDLLVDGVNGLVIDPRDTDALALGIRRLLEDRTFNAAVGKKGQETIETNFTIPHSVNGFLQAIDRESSH